MPSKRCAACSARPARSPIYTDSTYVIRGIREWIWAWRRRGWKTAEGGDVLNRELWEQLAGLVAARGKDGIDWHYVRGHTGIPGNERVDEIANAFALKRRVDLYDGPLIRYPIAVLDLPDDTSVPKRAAGTPGRQGARRRRTRTSASSTASRCVTRPGRSASAA